MTVIPLREHGPFVSVCHPAGGSSITSSRLSRDCLGSLLPNHRSRLTALGELSEQYPKQSRPGAMLPLFLSLFLQSAFFDVERTEDSAAETYYKAM